MNLSTQILAFLTETDEPMQVLLAPGAPPVARRGADVQVVSGAILNPMDIRETLATFMTHSRTNAPMSTQGVFSFGMAKMGRFRVNHFTQRGSSVVCIHRIPFAVPDLKSLLAADENTAFLDDLLETVGGLVLFAGSSRLRNTEIVYGVLKRINAEHGKVLYTVEASLSYLLRHEKSVVIQSEVGTDIQNVEEGIRNGIAIATDILYAGDVKTPQELVAVIDAADSGALVLLSQVTFGMDLLTADLETRLGKLFENFRGLLRRVVAVESTGDGVIRLRCSASL